MTLNNVCVVVLGCVVLVVAALVLVSSVSRNPFSTRAFRLIGPVLNVGLVAAAVGLAAALVRGIAAMVGGGQ